MWLVCNRRGLIRSGIVCTALTAHPNLCVAVVNCPQNSSSLLCCSILTAPLTASHHPSFLQAQLTAARRSRGNPHRGLDSAMAPGALPSSTPDSGSLQRDAVSGASSRSDGTVSFTAVVSGRAERSAEQCTSADALLLLWSRMMMKMMMVVVGCV